MIETTTKVLISIYGAIVIGNIIYWMDEGKPISSALVYAFLWPLTLALKVPDAFKDWYNHVKRT